MEELMGFGMRNSLVLPSSANKYFNSLGDERDETIYTYNDENMRYFERKNTKGGRCAALNQYYKSIICDKIFSNASTTLNVNVTHVRF